MSGVTAGPADAACMQAVSRGAQSHCARRPKRKRRAASAFGSILSEPMQEFLGQESMPRTEVVKRLWAYIKEHELQDPKNKRKIRCDAALLKLFKPPLDMFKMNKQLSKHVFAAGAILLLPFADRPCQGPCMTPAGQAAGSCMQVLHAAGWNHHLLLHRADRHHDEPEEDEEEEDDVEISEEEGDDSEEEDEEETPAKKKKAAAPRKREAAGGGSRGRQRDKAEDGEAKPKRQRTSSGGQGGCELSPEMRAFLGGVPRMPRPQVRAGCSCLISAADWDIFVG